MASTSGQAAKAVLLGLCCLLAACDTAAPEPDEPQPATSSPAASPSVTPSAPDDPSMGVAAARWPDQLDDLSAHVERLPPVLLDAKQDVYVDDEDSPMATALYGDVVYLTADLEHEIDTASGQRQRVTAEESLAALFNLGRACDTKIPGDDPPARRRAGARDREEVVGQDPLVLLHDRQGGGQRGLHRVRDRLDPRQERVAGDRRRR